MSYAHKFYHFQNCEDFSFSLQVMGVYFVILGLSVSARLEDILSLLGFVGQYFWNKTSHLRGIQTKIMQSFFFSFCSMISATRMIIFNTSLTRTIQLNFQNLPNNSTNPSSHKQKLYINASQTGLGLYTRHIHGIGNKKLCFKYIPWRRRRICRTRLFSYKLDPEKIRKKKRFDSVYVTISSMVLLGPLNIYTTSTLSSRFGDFELLFDKLRGLRLSSMTQDSKEGLGIST